MTPAQLKMARGKLGLTQIALAQALGVSNNTVSRWERGALAYNGKMLKLALAGLAAQPHLGVVSTP